MSYTESASAPAASATEPATAEPSAVDPATSPAAEASADEFVDVASASSDEDVDLPDPTGEDEVDASDEWAGLSLEECLIRATNFKSEGNEHFKAQRNQEAHFAYEQGIKCLTHHKEKPEALALLLSLHLNLAAACLRCELWPEAEKNASRVLEQEASNSKALFRRGVARARLNLLDEAKADLTAACRVDQKNREARSELNAVVERIAQRKQEEKKAMQGIFNSAGKGLYEDEERKRQAKLAEEKRLAKQKAEEEAAKEATLREEWEKECTRLRAERAASMDVEGGEKEDAMAVESGTEGEAAAMSVEEKAAEEPPISFEDFKKAKEEEEKKAKEEREAEERRRREAEEEARRLARAKADVVTVDDDEDLKGVVRGYKKRADGTTTSYFTREVDPATKALLDQMKQPKRISPSPVDEASQTTSWSGSAWNKAGTWEEKDLSKWAVDAIKAGVKSVVASSSTDVSSMSAMLERMKESTLDGADGGSRGLLDLAAELNSEMASATATITEVKNVEGVASIRSSRGMTKHAYDLSFEADFEITLEQVEPKEGKKNPKVKGTLNYSDVCPSADGPKAEVTYKLKKPPAQEYAKRADAAITELKSQVMQYLIKFDTELKQKAL